MRCSEGDTEWVRLRQQAHYWEAQHGRAVERERAWMSRALEAEKVSRELAGQIAERNEQIEALKARVALLQEQVFGQKSERGKGA